MPARDHEPLLRTSFFRVLIGERELGFAEVSELSSKTDAGMPGRWEIFEKRWPPPWSRDAQ